MRKILLILILLVSLNHVFATNYYFSKSGNDSNTGLSDAQAWLTVSKFNSFNFQPGDTAFLKCGDAWLNETYLYPHSGNSSAPFVIASYGTGEKPIIRNHAVVTGWNTAGNWTQSGNAWYMTFTGTVLRLWIDGVEVLASQTSSVTTTNRFYSNGTTLYIYSATNPATTFSSITYPSGTYSLYGINIHYVTVIGIDFQGGNQCIRMKGCDNWTFDNCTIGKDCQSNGIGANEETGVHETCDNGIVKNCTFNVGITSYTAWGWESKFTSDAILLGNGCSGWNIHNNSFYNWGHNTLDIFNSSASYPCQNNKLHDNYITAKDIDYGRGFGYSGVTASCTGNEIYKNTFYSLGSMNEINGPNLKMYYNITNIVRVPLWRLTTAAGLDFDGYSSGLPQNCEIYNNVFAYCDDPGLQLGLTGNARSGNIIKNNIIYECDADNGYGINIKNDANNYGNTYQNNIVYKLGVTNVVLYKTAAYSISGFNGITGTDTNTISGNIQSDPLFVSPSTGNFNLQSNSPAINAGLNVSLTTDLAGNEVVGLPDIGVYEYSSHPPGILYKQLKAGTKNLRVGSYNLAIP